MHACLGYELFDFCLSLTFLQNGLRKHPRIRCFAGLLSLPRSLAASICATVSSADRSRCSSGLFLSLALCNCRCALSSICSSFRFSLAVLFSSASWSHPCPSSPSSRRRIKETTVDRAAQNNAEFARASKHLPTNHSIICWRMKKSANADAKHKPSIA